MRINGDSSAGAITTDSAFQSGLAQRQIHEFPHLAAALADEADDDDIRDGLSGDESQQYALADTAAGHQSDALSSPQREHSVDGAHTHVQRLGYGPFPEGIDARGRRLEDLAAAEPPAAVDRLAEPIDHPAQPRRADTQRVALLDGRYPRTTVTSPTGLLSAIRKEMSLRKPTTCASTYSSVPFSTRHRWPVRSAHPVLSSSSPDAPTRRPDGVATGTAATSTLRRMSAIIRPPADPRPAATTEPRPAPCTP